MVIGPNGAGKTTFCDLVSGKTRPTTGKVYYDGREITTMDESDIALRGIGRKFQTPTVFDSLTTYENLLLALPGNQGWKSNLLKAETMEEANQIEEILEKVSLAEHRDKLAKSLSHGQEQWLAISALIIAKPKLLLVDEPAAGLTDLETEQTADLLLQLAKEHTLVVIEHDMDFVRRLDSKVTVLNEGKVLAEGTMAEMEKNEEVMEAYLGNDEDEENSTKSLRVAYRGKKGSASKWKGWKNTLVARPGVSSINRKSRIGPISSLPSGGGLSFSYGEVKVLHDLNFRLPAQTVSCVMGRNGVGKTTFLRNFVGLEKPSDGTIRMGGRA